MSSLFIWSRMEYSRKKVGFIMSDRHYYCQNFEISCSGVTKLLMAPGEYPGGSGTRNLHDNLSDLRAQVAANQKV